jgi:hypothetical protein
MITEPNLPPRRGAQVTACGTLAPVFVRKVELCRQWTLDVLAEVEGFEDVYGTNVSEVENRSRDGFIPFTDGGFDGIGYGRMGYAHGAGCVPEAIKPYLDDALKEVEKGWDENHPDHPVKWLFEHEEPHPTLPGIEPQRITKRDQLREEFYEQQDSYLSEGDTYFYKVRVLFHGDQHSSESGEPEAFFMVGINTDFEYGRDSIPWLRCYGRDPQCTKWLWEKTVKIKHLNARRIASLTRQAIKGLQNA